MGAPSAPCCFCGVEGGDAFAHFAHCVEFRAALKKVLPRAPHWNAERPIASFLMLDAYPAHATENFVFGRLLSFDLLVAAHYAYRRGKSAVKNMGARLAALARSQTVVAAFLATGLADRALVSLSKGSKRRRAAFDKG
eukprot:8565739-Lingulodinium_polyedra.AAC.1